MIIILSHFNVVCITCQSICSATGNTDIYTLRCFQPFSQEGMSPSSSLTHIIFPLNCSYKPVGSFRLTYMNFSAAKLQTVGEADSDSLIRKYYLSFKPHWLIVIIGGWCIWSLWIPQLPMESSARHIWICINTTWSLLYANEVRPRRHTRLPSNSGQTRQ